MAIAGDAMAARSAPSNACDPGAPHVSGRVRAPLCQRKSATTDNALFAIQ
jgi:hypothetical protein